MSATGTVVIRMVETVEYERAYTVAELADLLEVEATPEAVAAKLDDYDDTALDEWLLDDLLGHFRGVPEREYEVSTP